VGWQAHKTGGNQQRSEKMNETENQDNGNNDECGECAAEAIGGGD
jgi:hypothetical protein